MIYILCNLIKIIQLKLFFLACRKRTSSTKKIKRRQSNNSITTAVVLFFKKEKRLSKSGGIYCICLFIKWVYITHLCYAC
jgi:hypothetical protein